MANLSFRFALLVLSLFAACTFADQKVGRLFVLNSPSQLKFEQPSTSILPEDVAGVLSHLMGFSGLHTLPEVALPSGDVLQPKTNLLVVVDGAPLNVELYNTLEQSKLASFDVEDGSDETNHELLSRMFNGKKFEEETEKANLGDLLCQLHDDSLVLTLSTQAELLKSVSLHDQLAQQNPSWNAFRAFYDTKRSKLNFHGKPQSSLSAAIEEIFDSAEGFGVENVLDSEGKLIFDEASSIDEQFLIEMKALSQLLQLTQVSEVKALLNDASPDLIVFVSSSLKVLREKYGVDSLKFRTAWTRLTALLSKIQENVGETFKNEAIFEVLMVDAQEQAPVLSRGRRSVYKRDYTNIASTCFATFEDCQNATSNCSSEGNCTAALITQTSTCWRCKCNSAHDGDSCEFIDIIAPFHIIFWLSLGIIIVLILIVMALGNIDPGTDTLLFRTASSRPKKDN